MKIIKITQGFEAIIDDDDFEKFGKFKYHISKGKYAMRALPRTNGEKRNKRIKLHQDIIGKKEGFVIDHINGNGLDNRKCNLRHCTISQNEMNSPAQRNKTGKYKGVYKTSGKCSTFFSTIFRDGKVYRIGSFRDELSAAKAYDLKAKELFGEFAKTNF